MTAPALSHPRGFGIAGVPYPVVLPSWRDPRLQLGAVIVSLQVLGQVAFDFRLSIAQILIAVGTCGVLEVAIVLRRARVLAWPASALLTGNGVAFILRVPGTEHGDWWSTRGWWIFAGTAAVSLLSKYLIRVRGAHVFNPSNFGLVLCFLVLGPELADPLDFWWGPMSPALVLALAIIVVGGFAILSRLGLLAMALAFWAVFVGAIAVVAATGHGMTARWHFGPVDGLHFWTVLAFSPEILVFLFFMLTDPRTVPAGAGARIVFAVAVALLAALMIAFAPTEFWAKVAVLAALALACLARSLFAFAPTLRLARPTVAAVLGTGLVLYSAALVGGGLRTRPDRLAVPPLASSARLPRVDVLPSRGADSTLDRASARRIASDLLARLRWRPRQVALWLEGGPDQFPVIVARLRSPSRVQIVEVGLSATGYRITHVRSS